MPVHVALLRGINLGSRNKVNMPALRAALTTAGFTEVRTYVQSGNVVARTRHRSPDSMARAVREVVAERFGLDVAVVGRSPAELTAVLRWNPFPADARDRPTAVHVVHLDREPAADRVAELCDDDWSPDALAVRGREAVIRYGDVMHTSRLQYALVLRRLGVNGTVRNWRTLAAVAALAGEMTRA